MRQLYAAIFVMSSAVLARRPSVKQWQAAKTCPTQPKSYISHLSSLRFCFLFQITALKIKHNPFAKAFLDAKERYVCWLNLLYVLSGHS